ncbi:MAG TPA: hypothetical protein VGC37_08730 [Friedmanniella sp.]
MLDDPALRPRHAPQPGRGTLGADLRWTTARALAGDAALAAGGRLLTAERTGRHRLAADGRAATARIRDALAQRRGQLAPPEAFGRSPAGGPDREAIGR